MWLKFLSTIVIGCDGIIHLRHGVFKNKLNFSLKSPKSCAATTTPHLSQLQGVHFFI